MNKNVIAGIIAAFGIFNSINVQGQNAVGQQKKRPNIIFILTDDLGYGDLGVFYQKQRENANKSSEPWMFTPNLDALTRQGVQLTQQYCAAPVCAPSRASLLLGVSQGHANVRNNQFDKALEDNHTMASVLRKAGYTTAAIGKWGLQGDNRWDKNGAEWPGHPLNRGFDYFLGYMRHVDGHEHYPNEGLYRGAKEVWENRAVIDGLDKCYTGDLWTAATKRWIVDHKKGKQPDKPFFIYLAYDTPHAVLELPTQAYPSGSGIKGGLQWTGKKGNMINTASGTVDSWVHPDYANAVYDDDNDPSTPDKPWPDVYKRYATSVRRIDDGIGDLRALLKDLKIDSNTLIVFTSDNGPSLESYLPKNYAENKPDFFNSFGPFDGVKRDCWEGGVRVPSIACWPQHIPAGRKVASPSMTHDWLATFADAAGMPIPARTDGVSLLPSLTGSGKQKESLVYIEYFNTDPTPDLPEFHPDHRKRTRNQMQLIRFGDTVGVRYDIKSHADDFEIYDAVNDPGQSKNLAHNKGMDVLQKKMKEKVLQSRRPDTSAKRPYDNELIAAKEIKNVKPGVNWKGFSGNFPWTPNVAGLQPTVEGSMTSPSANKSGKNRVLFFDGYLKVPADGEYTFYLQANGGAILRIHEALVIDADYGYKGEEREGKILLKAGLHPFRLYYKIGSAPQLNFKWQNASSAKQDVPATTFWR